MRHVTIRVLDCSLDNDHDYRKRPYSQSLTSLQMVNLCAKPRLQHIGLSTHQKVVLSLTQPNVWGEERVFFLFRIFRTRLNFRLRVVPDFSSGTVERAKRERAWKSTHARKGFLAWVDFKNRFTALFTNMRIPKFKRRMTIAFFAAVNHAGHYKDLTETGNRARKVSGTQGTLFVVILTSKYRNYCFINQSKS